MRDREIRTDRVMDQCPGCGTSVVRTPNDPPARLPAECPNCQEVAAARTRGVEQTLAEAPSVVSSGELTALRRNVTALQRDVSQLTARLTAIIGDLADVRQAVQASEVAVAAPGKRRRA